MNKMKYFRVTAEPKITLEDISNGTGYSVGYLSHLENGSRENPSKEAMEKIAIALGKTVPEVFYAELTEDEAQELIKKGHNVALHDGKPLGEAVGCEGGAV